LWPPEVSHGLIVAERRDRLDAASASRFLELLRSLPIVVDPVARRRAFTSVRELARVRGLSAYDASYVELAVRLGVPLATLDKGLRRAAEKEGIEQFVPE
jgi:predicted nucleic acid-binding protein